MSQIIVYKPNGEIKYKLVGFYTEESFINYLEQGLFILEYSGDISLFTHVIDDTPVIITLPDTQEQIIATLSIAVQAYLDITAKSRNYDGILSLCTYATSLDPIFNAEGQAGVIWRDACWRKSYEIMTAVQANIIAIPTVEELLAELPIIIWPTPST